MPKGEGNAQASEREGCAHGPFGGGGGRGGGAGEEGEARGGAARWGVEAGLRGREGESEGESSETEGCLECWKRRVSSARGERLRVEKEWRELRDRGESRLEFLDLEGEG